MVSPAAILGLSATSSGSGIPSRVPQYLIFHFLFAYSFITGRSQKRMLGIGNNVLPRHDTGAKGEEAVRAGKITQKQLDKVRRYEAASANSVENYTLLVAGLLTAQHVGLPNQLINRAALLYTTARIVYAVAYITTDDWRYSLTRSTAWWVGNVSCLHLLWQAGKKLAL